MKVLPSHQKIKRRAFLTTVAATPAAAFAMPDTPIQEEPQLPDWSRKLVAQLQHYSAPHAGAGDRYSVVRKGDLTALCEAAGLPLEGHPVREKVKAKRGGDPHPAWLAEWRRLEGVWKSLEEDTPQEREAWDLRETYTKALANTKATTIEGLAAQFEWFREDLGDCVTRMVGADLCNVLDVIADGIGEVA